ncbi:unnamed protein product [Ilex paraguariensis]|uniref:Uncharacterized protein n=1 Tax=Ilex paraguariensis TaxID=185542 RepID=A0ABC8V4M4_9AQUA
MPTSTFQSERARTMWRSCLASAFRTAVASTIVGGATLYGPAFLRRQIAFPAFSYVTVILIVTDATLGDTLHGCCHALYATLQGVCPAILSLWVIGPARLTTSTTAAAVALSAFVVALPENTHLVAKRIALGQIVIVYVLAFINGVNTDAVMHPVHVAASTAIGAFACVVALLVPYPSLAYCEKSMQWERLPIKFLKPYWMNPGERLQQLEIPLRGMEIAFSSVSSFPVGLLHAELKDGLPGLEEEINLTLNQVKNSMPFDLTTVPESNPKNLVQSLLSLQTIPPIQTDLPSLFFLFSLNLLNNRLVDSSSTDSIRERTDTTNQDRWFFKGIWSRLAMNICSRKLIPAFKCSLSLGFAVLFGLIYSKENGYWSGLPVAISLASARQATFKVSNVKAQGTVLGTVYGVLRSRMYGQAGGISAVIGAVLILGRENFGPPSEFAIARVIETFIGLSCSIMVEILFQPTRASILAKIHLSKSLKMLHECVGSVNLYASKAKLEESLYRLKTHVDELRKYIEEAEAEPNFWFFPFHCACYYKLLGSLSNMVDFLLFGTHAIRFLQQESSRIDNTVWNEAANKLNCDLELFKNMVVSPIKCFQEVTLIKSLTVLEKELSKNDTSYDLELGKSPIPTMFRLSRSDEDEIERTMSSYLQHSNEALESIQADADDEKQIKTQLVLSLSALVFCISALVRETREIEKGIQELMQWENPSSNINLYEISCKVYALYK